jgi:radical SAM protein with 4Fe4S-binding SPASM domain
MDEDLSHAETRAAVDLIIDRTEDLHRRGKPKEVLTVDNHADGPYLYLRLLREGSPRAAEVLELLQMNEGNSSGRGIGCISWDGSVHADQFWRHYSFGNVRQRPFSEIWADLSNPLMNRLKDKKPWVKGRCAECRWLELCGGNFRVRAEAANGDLWAPDPACYLTDAEIQIDQLN